MSRMSNPDTQLPTFAFLLVLALPLLTGADFDVRDLEVLADCLAWQVGVDAPAATDLLAYDLKGAANTEQCGKAVAAAIG